MSTRFWHTSQISGLWENMLPLQTPIWS
jgi:hypothetical protein